MLLDYYVSLLKLSMARIRYASDTFKATPRELQGYNAHVRARTRQLRRDMQTTGEVVEQARDEYFAKLARRLSASTIAGIKADKDMFSQIAQELGWDEESKMLDINRLIRFVSLQAALNA